MTVVTDCFEVALRLTVLGGDLALEDNQIAHVVHGLPVGRGPMNAGKRYWHAWVEVTTGDSVEVIDRSHGLDLQLPRDRYYAFGQLDDDHVWRFTPKEAAGEALERGHMGPWVDGWRDLEEVA